VVVKSVFSERPSVSKSDAVGKIILMQPKPEPALTKMLHESARVRSIPSLPEEPHTPAPESTSHSMRVKKEEGLFHPIIIEAADRYEVDFALIKAIIMVESSYNPNAISRRGAKGLMQLMPKTAEARKYNGVPPFKATRCYIEKVFKYHQYYKKQMAW
jgi:hypothetical protein